jgi:hypothetical protein
MTYTAEVVIAELRGIESDEGMPVVRLPDQYPTIEHASVAARTYIKQLGRPLGSAFYHILDENGHDSGRG